MDLVDALIIILIGAFAGFLNVAAGGGSLITVPLLIFLGLPSNVANATNRVAIFFQNTSAVVGFKKKGVSAFPYSLYLGGAALLGAILGAEIAVEVTGKLFNRILSLVMLMVVGFMVFKPARSGTTEKMSAKHQIIGVVTFFGVGIYGGFIQAGVGFIIMAALTGINGFTLVKTNSAKVFIILVYTSSALIVFVYEGLIDWYYGITLALGNAIGGWVGSQWSVAKGDKWIRRLVILTVIGLAAKLWFFGD